MFNLTYTILHLTCAQDAACVAHLFTSNRYKKMFRHETARCPIKTPSLCAGSPQAPCQLPFWAQIVAKNPRSVA